MSEKTSSPNPSLARRTPPAPLTFDQAFDALWNRAQAALGTFPFETSGVASLPEFRTLVRAAPTDVVDTGSAYQVHAEVPGIAKDQIDIRVNGNVVEISGEDKTEKTESGQGYLHRERIQSSFHRAFELPEPVVAEAAKAKVVNGVLELELPKQKPTPQPTETRIQIE